jgi:hypothetical protein
MDGPVVSRAILEKAMTTVISDPRLQELFDSTRAVRAYPKQFEKRDEAFILALNKLIAERRFWEEEESRIHTAMQGEIDALKKRLEASERMALRLDLLLQRIEVNGGIGAYTGGPAFVVQPAMDALADYRATQQESSHG